MRRIDRETGLLAPDGLEPKRVFDEHFLDGTGPTEYAVLPGEATEESFLLDQLGFGEDGGAGEPSTPPPEPTPGLAPVPAPVPPPVPPRRGPRDPEDLPAR